MMRKRAGNSRGQALVEFTLAAIPMIFLLISIEEISRGMWIYVTLAHAVKEGTRYSIVHGADCVQADSSCGVSVGQIAAQIRDAGKGLDAGKIGLVLQSAGSTRTCAPLSTCLNDSTAWPASPDNGIGLPVTMSGTYPFNTAMSMFVPQAGTVHFGALLFRACSREEVRY